MNYPLFTVATKIHNIPAKNLDTKKMIVESFSLDPQLATKIKALLRSKHSNDFKRKLGLKQIKMSSFALKINQYLQSMLKYDDSFIEINSGINNNYASTTIFLHEYANAIYIAYCKVK